MKAIIKPSKASGIVQAPPSKSMAHRMLICAGLAKGKSSVKGIAPSSDVLATLDCLSALGAKYEYKKDEVVIYGVNPAKRGRLVIFPCRECGSTLRFFIPIAMTSAEPAEFTGSGKLFERPLSVYEDLCFDRGFLFKRKAGGLKVCGCLAAGEYEVRGDISSQFISGLLFALLHAEGDSVIKILPPVSSRPYIDMTIQAMSLFGADVDFEYENSIFIRGGRRFSPRNVSVEGDYSNAAFFEALNAAGGNVSISGLNENSLQGDKIYGEYFRELKNGSPVLDISNVPDLGPVLMAVAAMKNGALFTGTKRLRIKESDRGEAMRNELEHFGIKVNIARDSIEVRGGSLRAPNCELCGHNDHRIVMALAVLCTLTGGTINEAQAVRKSFPDFFEKLKLLNIEVETDGVDQ